MEWKGFKKSGTDILFSPADSLSTCGPGRAQDSHVGLAFMLAGLVFMLAGLAFMLAGLAFMLAGLAFMLTGLVFMLAGLAFKLAYTILYS